MPASGSLLTRAPLKVWGTCCSPQPLLFLLTSPLGLGPKCQSHGPQVLHSVSSCRGAAHGVPPPCLPRAAWALHSGTPMGAAVACEAPCSARSVQCFDAEWSPMATAEAAAPPCPGKKPCRPSETTQAPRSDLLLSHSAGGAQGSRGAHAAAASMAQVVTVADRCCPVSVGGLVGPGRRDQSPVCGRVGGRAVSGKVGLDGRAGLTDGGA